MITHPSIVRVLSFGMKGADAYIAMELFEGETLEERLHREQCLAPIDAVRLLLPIARALEAAHEHGVVHRDVKPANIFLASENGEVVPKLLDFGIARAELLLPRRLTVTGQVMGTPHYMSPEQAAGRSDVDHRADIWALCAVVYESIAGVPPFDGDNYNALLSAVLTQPLTPLSQVSRAGEALCRLVGRGLQKKREQRYASAGELADALDQWSLNRTALARTEERCAPTQTGATLTQTALMFGAPEAHPSPPLLRERRPRAWLAPRLPTVGLAPLAVAASFVVAMATPVIAWGVVDAARAASGWAARAASLTPATAPLPQQSGESLAVCEPAPMAAVGVVKSNAKETRAGAMPLPLAPDF